MVWRLDRNTNRRIVRVGRLGDDRVQLRSNSCSVLAALATALALAGCADVDWSSPQAWFSKRLDVTGDQKGGYSFSELQETKQRQRPITANELVNSNGSCPAPAVAPAPPQAPGQAAAPAAPAAPAADTAALLGGGIALGMSECDVVFRAGQPSAVQIGSLPNGDRTAVLTFDSGPRAGIYHFQRGALREMDSMPVAAAPPRAIGKKAAKAGRRAKVKKENES
jgi:hypothetical protein